MTETYVHFRLPFAANLGTPSTIYAQILVRGVVKLFNVSYRVNSYDGKLYVAMVEVSTGNIVCTIRVVKNGSYLVKDENGRIMFVLFVRDENPENPNIWLFDEAQMNQFAGATT